MPAMKSQTSLLLAALAAAPALVAAHGHVVSISINGKEFPGFQPGNPSADSVGWATTVTDNGFVLASAANTADVICHRGATNAANSAPVNAGDSITIKWDTWPQSHVGPIIDYLASCNGDCSSVDKSSLEFFKINQGGLLDGASKHWVTDDLITDGMTWTTTIPASLAPGSYVLRHEIVALHEGNRQGAAQLYPQCINLEVTGTGSEKPAGVVGTSLYTPTDPGILFDVYNGATSYPIPGPALAFGAGGGNGGSNPAPAPAPSPSAPASNPPANGGGSAAPAPTTLATATSAAQPAPTKPANGGGNSQGAALYAQCGGQGFTGATSCAEGSCVKQNDYYSQCIPK